VKICLVGAEGKMGRAIQAELQKQSGHVLALVEKDKEPKDIQSTEIDVVLDFSSPTAAVKWAQWCAEKKVPFVTGTTGLGPEQQGIIQKAARTTALLQSANMSVGVTILAKILEEYSGRLRGFDVFIEETHHKNKKDKPSGTAKLLRQAVEKSGEKLKNEPTSHRVGEIFGIHKVRFVGPGEILTFEHEATGREVFAQGALKAASWILKQKPGIYSMRDVIKGQGV
jgi:4-hydroxy-tetrahydrodipicolinate reductase